MTSIERIDKGGQSLKMKTHSLIDKISKISLSFNAIKEVQRIITRDGFGYFSTTND